MNNILSYCGLVDAKISSSEKDLPVINKPDENSDYLPVIPEMPEW